MFTRTAAIAVCVLLGFCVSVPAAQAQGKCSLETFAGTYVSFDRGASVTIDLASSGVLLPMPGAPLNPIAWSAPGIVPFVNIANVTYTPDGKGEGYFWMFAGTARPALAPTPLQVTITELNEDCTGKFQYTLPNGQTIVERFIMFDNGREYRSIPVSGGIPTLAWIGTGHRVITDGEGTGWCGPGAVHGSYLMTCDNIMRTIPYPTKAVADTLMVRMDFSTGGDYTGTLFERYGMSVIDRLPVSGSYTVNADCSSSNTLVLEGHNGWIEQRGVFFNEGKEFYSMGLLNPTAPDDPGIKYSFCHGIRIK